MTDTKYDSREWLTIQFCYDDRTTTVEADKLLQGFENRISALEKEILKEKVFVRHSKSEDEYFEEDLIEEQMKRQQTSKIEKKEPEIKNCRFCGEYSVVRQCIHYPNEGRYNVSCHVNTCEFTSPFKNNKEEAIKIWNELNDRSN